MSGVNKLYHIIFSERAGEMLVQYVRFLAQVNTQAAEKLRLDVIGAAKSLQKFPEQYSRLTDPALPANKYRKLLVDKRYLLICQIKDDTVYIDYILLTIRNPLFSFLLIRVPAVNVLVVVKRAVLTACSKTFPSQPENRVIRLNFFIFFEFTVEQAADYFGHTDLITGRLFF